MSSNNSNNRFVKLGAIAVAAILVFCVFHGCGAQSATQEEVSQLQQEYDALQEEYTSLQGKRDDLKAEVDSLEKQKEELQIDVASIEEDKDKESELMVKLTFFDLDDENEYEVADESTRFYSDPYLTQRVTVDFLDSAQKWTVDLDNGNTVTAVHGYYYITADGEETTTYQRGMVWTADEVSLSAR